MPSPDLIVVIATGGTISAHAGEPGENVAYETGAIDAAALLRSARVGASMRVETIDLARIDSKDIDFATWRSLACRVAAELARPEVCGIVVTHGTDTLEETAWLLQRVLAARKPVVLTAAMRPASSRQADGPQNLADALAVAAAGHAGVVVVLAGTVHSARAVTKRHPYRLDAFSSGDAGPLAYVEEGRLRVVRAWPGADGAHGIDLLDVDPAQWPLVGIVNSTGGADRRSVEALVDAGFQGLVVATTGNGTVHRALDEALAAARQRGVAVLRSTRCLDGSIVEPLGDEPLALRSAGDLTPVKARIELLLELLGRRAPKPA